MNKILMALIALAGITTSVNAETVNFSGTVTTSCAFSNANAGELMASSNGYEYILASGTGPNSGMPATVDITYAGSPSFTISAVSNVTSTATVPALTGIDTGIWFGFGGNNNSAISAGANNFSSGSKTFLLSDLATSDTAYFKMRATANSAFPAGTYEAQTTITCQ